MISTFSAQILTVAYFRLVEEEEEGEVVFHMFNIDTLFTFECTCRYIIRLLMYIGTLFAF